MFNIFKTILVIGFFTMSPYWAMADSPDCSSPDNWASNIAYGELKNAGILQNESTDFSKTIVERLASENLGHDLYRQIHRITFTKKSGDTVTVITVNNASHEECSMSGVKVFVISKQFGGLNQ